MGPQHNFSGNNERRRFIRVPFQRNISYRLCYERLATEVMEASAHNISQNGILFKTKYPPTHGAIVSMMLEIDKLRAYVTDQGLTDVIDVDKLYVRGQIVFGEVVRVIREDNSDFYSVAVQLVLQKDEAVQARIAKAVKESHPQYIDPTVVPVDEKYDVKLREEQKKSHPQYIDPSLAPKDEE